MPRYDYLCLECSNEFEAYAKVAERLDTRCPCGGQTKILISAPALALFEGGWFEHIAPDPIYCSTPQELREACDKHGGRSHYLADRSYWRTSPGQTEDEALESSRKAASEGSDDPYITLGDG